MLTVAQYLIGITNTINQVYKLILIRKTHYCTGMKKQMALVRK